MQKKHFALSAFKAVLLGSIVMCASVIAQQRIDLYPTGAVPGVHGTDTIKDIPCLYIYQPASGSRNGSAMVICPGGAYTGLTMGGEGSDEATYFNTKGMTCFVLRYRLCSNGYTRYPIRNDGLRAMRLVRARAKQWGLDTARIGVMGFSAGGHMASMMSTQFDNGNPVAADTVERISDRPSFSVLGYPVITCTQPYAWSGLFGNGNFIGPNPSPALVDSFSGEKRITTRTPMAFLFNDTTDWAVPYQNCVLYRDSCLKKKVPVTWLRVHNCSNSHGFGMGCGNWADTAAAWMKKQGIFTITSTVGSVVSPGIDGPREAVVAGCGNRLALPAGLAGKKVAVSLFDIRGRLIGRMAPGIASVIERSGAAGGIVIAKVKVVE